MHLAVYSDALELGGAEVNLSRVLAALPRDVHVSIVGVHDAVVDWLWGHRRSADRMVLPAISGRRDLTGMLRHRAMFARLGADVLQFNLSSASSCQWAILAAATLPDASIVVVENSPMGVWSSSSARLKQLTARRLSAHIAVGERTARIIEQAAGLVPGSIETLYHGVDDVTREPVERPQGPTLLTVARHDPVKGIDVLLDAMALVRAPAQLVLVGDGTETAALRRRCDELGLAQRVEFRHLPWDGVRVADTMWAFDALVLPSRLEGFPVTIVEAMLAALPVIATDVGSVAEAVQPGVTGWIVPPEDPEALAAAIDDLLAQPERAEQMGRAARERALEHFTIDATVEHYLALYRKVRSGRR